MRIFLYGIFFLFIVIALTLIPKILDFKRVPGSWNYLYPFCPTSQVITYIPTVWSQLNLGLRDRLPLKIWCGHWLAKNLDPREAGTLHNPQGKFSKAWQGSEGQEGQLPALPAQRTLHPCWIHFCPSQRKQTGYGRTVVQFGCSIGLQRKNLILCQRWPDDIHTTPTFISECNMQNEGITYRS